MSTRLWFIMNGAICFALIVAINHFLNKDYNLNGAKRLLSNSKYGRIVYWCSLVLITLMTFSIRRIVEIDGFAQHFHLSNWFCTVLRWVVAPLISFITVGSLFVFSRTQYLSRKIFGQKDDENDSLDVKEN
jgi:hypothetical protein